MHRWCLLNLTVQGFSLNLTVRGVSNKHCLLTFFIHSRRVVSYKGKYVHKVLVNRLRFKLALEKVWLGKLTVPT